MESLRVSDKIPPNTARSAPDKNNDLYNDIKLVKYLVILYPEIIKRKSHKHLRL